MAIGGKRLGLDIALVVALAMLLVVAPVLMRLPFAEGFGGIGFIGGPLTGGVILAMAVGFFVATLFRSNADARALGLMVFSLFASITLAASFAPMLPDHPFFVVYVCTPALFALASLYPRAFAGAYAWLKVGVLSRRVIVALAILVPASLASLAVYFMTVRPDLTHQPLMRSGISPGVWLVAVGLVIAALNAAVEEAIYRGILFHSLERMLQSPVVVIAIQAAAFGAFHFNSNEPGLTGVAVTFVLGLVLGALRFASGGLAAPYILHFAMDIGVWNLGLLQLRA